MDGVDYFFARSRLLTAVLVVILLVWSTVRTILSPTPPVSQSLVNGTYVSTCCGCIMLHDGVMTFDGGTVRYRLTVGKTDLSADFDGSVVVAANHKVTFLPGVQASAFDFWRYPHRSNMMNIYNARLEPPDRLSIWGQDNSGPYDFARLSR